MERTLKALHSRGMQSVKHPMRDILKERAEKRFSERFAQRIDNLNKRKNTPSPMQKFAAKALLANTQKKRQEQAALSQMSFSKEAEVDTDAGGTTMRESRSVRDAETLERAYAGMVITKHYRKSKMAKRMGVRPPIASYA